MSKKQFVTLFTLGMAIYFQANAGPGNSETGIAVVFTTLAYILAVIAFVLCLSVLAESKDNDG